MKGNEVDDVSEINARLGTNDVAQFFLRIGDAPVPKIGGLLVVVIEHEA